MNTHCSDRALEMKGRHSWPIMRIDILHLPVCYFFEIKVTKRQAEKSSERKRIFLYSVTYFDHSKSNLHSYNLLKVHWVHSSPVENDISILKTVTEVSLDFDSMLQSIFNKRTTHRLTSTAHHSSCAVYTDMCMLYASIDLSHSKHIQPVGDRVITSNTVIDSTCTYWVSRSQLTNMTNLYTYHFTLCDRNCYFAARRLQNGVMKWCLKFGINSTLWKLWVSVRGTYRNAFHTTNGTTILFYPI